MNGTNLENVWQGTRQHATQEGLLAERTQGTRPRVVLAPDRAGTAFSSFELHRRINEPRPWGAPPSAARPEGRPQARSCQRPSRLACKHASVGL